MSDVSLEPAEILYRRSTISLKSSAELVGIRMLLATSSVPSHTPRRHGRQMSLPRFNEIHMSHTPEEVAAGQAAYTPQTLPWYDFVVLSLSNRWIWKCPTARMLQHYSRHVSANHLDVGVGSGYFVDCCRFPSEDPRVALMDLNRDALSFAAQRISPRRVEIHHANVLEPISGDIRPFDSIAVNYLLHCLPGSIRSKAVVFDHLTEVLNSGGVIFGATLLQGGVRRGWLARRLMSVYNRRGIFFNGQDDLDGLRLSLETRFRDVSIEVHGCGALFSGRK